MLWAALAALSFFVVSHPRELLPDFSQSLLWLLCLSALVVIVDLRRVRPPALSWPVVAFLGLCAASTLWSVDPGATTDALLLYGGVALLACLIVGNTETGVLLSGIVWGALLVTGVTLGSALAGIEGAGGPVGEAPLLGMHGNRNIVSYTLVLGLAAALSLRPSGSARSRAVRQALRGLATVVIVGGIYLASSGTGLVAAAALILVAGALSLSRWTRVFATVPAKIIGAAVLASLLVVLFSLSGAVFELLGKRSDFSGRVPLWRAIVRVWEGAPVGGYGWGAVWPYSWFSPDVVSAPKAAIDAGSRTALVHGHNIVFDLLPQLGLLGVLVVVVMIGCSVGWLFVRLDERDYVVARWAALGAAAILVNGVTEPMVSVPVGWFVLVTIVASSSSLRRRRAGISS